MRGDDPQQHEFFGYGSLEDRAPPNHPLRPVRATVDEALQALDGRKSIPPELYSIRSERMLMEQEGEIAEEFFRVVATGSTGLS